MAILFSNVHTVTALLFGLMILSQKEDYVKENSALALCFAAEKGGRKEWRKEVNILYFEFCCSSFYTGTPMEIDDDIEDNSGLALCFSEEKGREGGKN